MKDIAFLKKKATQIRIDVLNMIYDAKAGHIGGAYSCTDILTTLYYSIMNIDSKKPKCENRDRFVLSKGHAVEPLWAILADKGFIKKDELKTFSKFGSRIIGHPNNKVLGIEMNTGSLGHGLPIVVGMALAAKMDNKTYRSYTIIGDGELAEGSIWEAAMAASHYKLDNLVAIIDRNMLQITGSTEEVMALEPLDEKFRSFGWGVMMVDGNDIKQLVEALTKKAILGKPTMIIAKTVKTKGISFAQNLATWHHRVPSSEEYNLALEELNNQLEDLE